ncbi:transposase, partial [Streptomyces sp. ADMS]|uniref:transposase n=1 Tax=Streptomyces sp. ADMS TaxID=3071415 RepID=UPI00296E90DA
MIVVAFTRPACGPCPVRESCTTSRRGFRQLTLNPRPLTEALRTARAEQAGRDWQDAYALRSGVEGTIRQALAVTDSRRARYRGLAK